MPPPEHRTARGTEIATEIASRRSDQTMSRASRTAIELEQMIVAQVRANNACRSDFTVKVVGINGRWDAFPGPIDKETYPDCLSVFTYRIGASCRIRSRRIGLVLASAHP